MESNQAARGFTLIELMIVVAIIAILAAVAYPSYKESVARGNRASAQSALLQHAQWMERQFSISNAYNLEADRVTAITSTELNLKVPLDSKTAQAYTLSFGDNLGLCSTPTATCFKMRMDPISPGAMAGDRCGTFFLDHTGAQTVSGSSGSSSCWAR